MSDSAKEAEFNARFDVIPTVRNVGEKTGRVFIEPTFAELLADLQRSRARRKLLADSEALVLSDSDDEVEILRSFAPPPRRPLFIDGFNERTALQTLFNELDEIADGSRVDCLGRSSTFLTSAVFRYRCGLVWVHRSHLDADWIREQLLNRYSRNPASALSVRCVGQILMPNTFVELVLFPHALIRIMQIGTNCAVDQAQGFLSLAV